MLAEDGTVGCNKCKRSSAESEQVVEAKGWLVDRSVPPTVHICPTYLDAAPRRTL